MNRTIDVEIIDLSYVTPYDHYVIIRVDVGKMPPSRIQKYISDVKKNFELCRKLERKNIQYSVIGCRSDGTQAIEVSVEYKDEEPVSNTTMYDEAMEIVK